jgi:energy-coupling factor transport system ATP-binding protein
VNLDIEPGDITAIVGENGAGKTTLVRHINGLLKPSEGKVTVLDLNTRKVSIAELSKKVGVVFQNPDHQLFSDTVSNEILFGLTNFHFNKREAEERLEWALDYFDLKDYRNKSPMMLSGGEKKRLCIACILAWEPQIIILDEPTVGQDYFQKERIREMLLELRDAGKIVIVVSHDIEFLWPLRPKLIAMSKGSIIAHGRASEILARQEIILRSKLVVPQLLELWRVVPLEGDYPSDVKEAAERIDSLGA